MCIRASFDMLREGQKAGFLLKGGYGSQGDAGKGVASVYGLLGENIGVMASLVRQDGDDYEDGNGNRVSPTGFDHRRQQFKLSGRFTDNQMDFSYEDLKDTGTYYERPHMTDYAGRFVLSDHELHRRTATYTPVSYTHLDVYKRQRSGWSGRCWRSPSPSPG